MDSGGLGLRQELASRRSFCELYVACLGLAKFTHYQLDSKIPQFPYLRLYLPEERAAVTADNRYLVQYLESIGGPDQELLHRIYLSNKGIPYTVIRFCDSIKGFHTVSHVDGLCLTCPHEAPGFRAHLTSLEDIPQDMRRFTNIG